MYGLTFAFHTFYFKLFRLIVFKKETPIGRQFAQIISNVYPRSIHENLIIYFMF